MAKPFKGPDPKVKERGPKRERRIVDAGVYTKKHLVEKECRRCGETRGLMAHHLVPRKQGGDDVNNNLIMLCEPCHSGWHGAQRKRFGKEIRVNLAKSEVGYVRKKKGAAWLEIHYGAT